MRERDRVEQLARARRAVLRLLHRERDQIVLAGLYVAGAVGDDLAWERARIDLDLRVFSFYRKPDADAIAIDRFDLRRKTNERDVMASER